MLFRSFKITGTSVANGVMIYLPKLNMSGGPWTNGDKYIVRFTLSSVSGGSVSVGTNTATFYTATAEGDHVALVDADGETEGLVFTSADAIDFDGVISNISAVPFNGLALDVPLGIDNLADSRITITLQER